METKQEKSISNHYDMPIQPIEFIQKNNLTFIEGNIVKYVCRHSRKGKQDDIKKVIHYGLLMLQLEYGCSKDEINQMLSSLGVNCVPNTQTHSIGTNLSNGVYILYLDGRVRMWMQGLDVSDAVGVVVSHNGHTFRLGASDITDTALIPDEDKCEKDHPRYMTEVQALNDWDYVAGTSRIMELGSKIELDEGYYIPTLEQLHAVGLYIDDINAALAAVGHEPLNKNSWYWSSSEYSATNAWTLNLYNGTLYNGSKASQGGRVRAVTAF